MMPSPLALPLFITSTIIGTLFSLSSTHWLMVWIGLEINLISFTSLMILAAIEAESAIKYFLVQAFASLLLMTGMMISSTKMPTIPLSNLMIIFSASVKLGMSPFHMWFPSVMNGLPWNMCLILNTWQKLAPFFIIIFIATSFPSPFFILICLMSALVGGLGGINQSQMRPMMAYSSINHMSWICITALIKMSSFIIYISFYLMMTSAIMVILSSLSIFMTSVFLPSFLATPHHLMLSTLFFSMAGLPPLSGFAPKWLIISFLMDTNLFFISIILILGSLLTLMYYLSFSLNLFVSLNKKKTMKNTLFSVPNFLGLLLISLLILSPLLFM